MLLSAASATGAQDQGLTVATITVDGQRAQSVAGVQLRLAGAASVQTQTLKVGAAIPPGAELTLPRGASVELTSSNGNTIALHPGARFLAGVVTAKGESHQPLGGRIDFQVKKALDFFNIQYERITASVKGTDYSVEIDPAKSLKVSVSEGVVEIERQVQIKFADAASGAIGTDTTRNQGNGIRVAEDLKAGQSKTYRLDVEEYLAEFKNFGEAEAYFKKALADAEVSGNKRRVLRAVENLMELYWKIGEPRATLKLEGRCIELAQELSELVGEAECLYDAGIAYNDLGDYLRSIAFHEKSLAIKERFYAGRDHAGIAASLNSLGITYRLLSEYRKSIAYYEKSLAMKERLNAMRDHRSIATSLNNLGIVYGLLGNHGKSIEYFEKSLSMRERVYAEHDHPDFSQSFTNLGIAHNSLGEYRKAIDYHTKSLALSERLYAGRDHADIAGNFINLGSAYHSLRDYRKANEYYIKSLAMQRRLYAGRDHRGIAASLDGLGVTYDSLGDYHKAIDYYEKSLAIKERIYAGHDHAEIAENLSNLGGAYYSLGEYDKTMEYYEKALAILERVYVDHSHIVQLLRSLAVLHNRVENPTQGARYRERAEAMTQRLKGTKK